MISVLVTNQFLRDFTGSELACLDLAGAFLRRGWLVTLACFEHDEPLARQVRELGIAPVLLDTLEPAHFDLIWAHHFTTLDYCLLELGITAERVIFSSLSPYEPLESPPLCADRVNLFLANSPETRATLLEMGLAAERVALFSNPVSEAFFEHRPGPPAERPRLALVSNHVPPELKAALPLLAERGVEVTLFGKEGRFELVTPALLGEFDGVISIGRTVQYGLAMGLPVFCYDHFAGPGWLSPANIERAAEYNFSGRCSPTARSAAQLADALVDGFAVARQVADGFVALARDRYHLGECLTEVLSRAEQPPLPPSTDCYRVIALRQREYMRRARQPQTLHTRLYIDQGAGFCEQHQTSRELTPPYARTRLQFALHEAGQQGQVRALRLDPLDAPCVVRLRSMVLLHNGTRQELAARVTSNALWREDECYYFLTRDPQWWLTVSEAGVTEQASLEVELEFVVMHQPAIDSCLAHLEQQQQQGAEQLSQLQYHNRELEAALQRMQAHPVWRCLRAVRRLLGRSSGVTR
ncbi:hypothetical protein [Oceanisphaera arctica]|uniref:Glycosyltransferase n=1 Tax=Oceanisphaera arctica TaxID=641510 RepID=A0A2P5TLM8_9GAMM|nr:hypothetical protein [Oceanisphaera arctica]PPL16170.1 hypothetical protein UN63_10030 [Oceanisphaera arctica]GHA06352.1 hypothetical protein GCM10007082_04230 [Oceanisphaera arctica]